MINKNDKTVYCLARIDDEFDLKDYRKIKQECTMEQFGSDFANHTFEKIEIFSNLESARNALSSYKSTIGYLPNYYLVTEYVILIGEIIDDEFEWTDSYDDVSEMQIKVVAKPSYETIGVFDNMAEAKAFADSVDDETYID